MPPQPPQSPSPTVPGTPSQVLYDRVTVDGIGVAYREAGQPGHSKLVLLHGYPASSHQYRNLVVALADRFHVVAPDYPGFGHSDVPDPASFAYTFDNLSAVIEGFLEQKGFDRFGLYVQDYGGPVGFRIMGRKPESLEWLIVQNANAYEVGFTAAWDGFRQGLWLDRSAANEQALAGLLTHDAIRDIYLHGATDPRRISPDAWMMDWAGLQRPHAARLNLDLFYDYRTNVTHYPAWQEFLRTRQPPTLLFWGQDDVFFSKEGGEAYLDDLPDAEMHRLEAGHFATEDHLDTIADRMHHFYAANVRSPASAGGG